jgi:hypothetical protein
MSLYELAFSDPGRPDRARVLLAVLGNPEMGRFRDAWLEKTNDGPLEVAVYTRNGGGNRECWHDSDPTWGEPGCKHETFHREKSVWLNDGEGEPQPEWRVGRQWPRRTEYLTGEFEEEVSYKCLAPDSIECDCVGCIAQYRLPTHPLYIRDKDDNFDCTYATFYFKVPDEFVEALEPLAGTHIDTSKRWADTIAAIQEMKP